MKGLSELWANGRLARSAPQRMIFILQPLIRLAKNVDISTRCCTYVRIHHDRKWSRAGCLITEMCAMYSYLYVRPTFILCEMGVFIFEDIDDLCP